MTSVLALPADTLPPRLTDADVASYNAEMARLVCYNWRVCVCVCVCVYVCVCAREPHVW